MKQIRKIYYAIDWYIYLLLKRVNPPLTAEKALKKMCKIAKVRYSACTYYREGKPQWNYDITWTPKMEAKFKKWFLRKLPRRYTDKYNKNTYSMFSLEFGFRDENSGKEIISIFVL